MRERSTMANLFSYTDLISKVLDQGGEVHSITTAFSKAFVDQNILLNQLEN